MIINSPLFEERKAALVRELRGDSRGGLLADIERDAMRNFATLQELRDTETLPARIRLRAAQTIAQQLDRVLPRDGRVNIGGQSGAARVVISMAPDRHR